MEYTVAPNYKILYYIYTMHIYIVISFSTATDYTITDIGLQHTLDGSAKISV